MVDVEVTSLELEKSACYIYNCVYIYIYVTAERKGTASNYSLGFIFNRMKD